MGCYGCCWHEISVLLLALHKTHSSFSWPWEFRLGFIHQTHYQCLDTAGATAIINRKNTLWEVSGGGSVGGVVASDMRRPVFDSHHQHITYFSFNSSSDKKNLKEKKDLPLLNKNVKYFVPLCTHLSKYSCWTCTASIGMLGCLRRNFTFIKICSR